LYVVVNPVDGAIGVAGTVKSFDGNPSDAEVNGGPAVTCPARR
jgi:hypothetical protein